MAKLPISVCVALCPYRSALFFSATVPSLEANEPAEIIVEDEGANANVKRNAAAAKATQPFLFFCDDDVVLDRQCLPKLLHALERADKRTVGYAYSDYIFVNNPRRGTGRHAAGAWSAAKLKAANFVATMSLVRAEAFPGFDESIERLQDYDLWLNMLLTASLGGVYVPEALFVALYDPSGTGTTKRNGFDAAMRRVHRKWRIG